MPKIRRTDRRVQRTHDLLHEALASLIHEKSYDAIVVKEILGRANVGRSTFYTHFRDKDELLDSGIRDMLRVSEAPRPIPSTGLADRILRFSLPIFEHIERYRNAGDTPLDTHAQSVVHDHLERALTESIAAEVRAITGRRQETRCAVPRDLLARHLASTFVLVLEWWVENPTPLSAKAADEVFRALALPSVVEVMGA
jgi:AcrR family transcriptional regulator